ncbi:MAG TPA: hypothetical protein VEC36_02435 [Patescibacteria group bacterium]|nr:hypothetical protein [Patescibacteria group bacterium]
MKKPQLVCLALLSVFLLDSCATKLPIPIHGKTALYRYRTAGGAQNTDIEVTPRGTFNPLVIVADVVGSGIAGYKIAEKLDRAISEDSLASIVSEGLEATSQMYCGVKFVPSLENNPDLIFETEVLEYAIISNEAGAGLHVRARTRLLERATSKEIWDSEEIRFVPFRESGWNLTNVEGTVNTFLNLKEIFEMPDEELAKLMYGAAYNAGEYFGEQLREVSTKD